MQLNLPVYMVIGVIVYCDDHVRFLVKYSKNVNNIIICCYHSYVNKDVMIDEPAFTGYSVDYAPRSRIHENQSPTTILATIISSCSRLCSLQLQLQN